MRLFAGTPFDRPPRCEQCGALDSECVCPPVAAVQLDPAKQTAKIAVEKRAKGKVVTVVRGLSSDGNDLADLLARLKSACGAGGTLRDGELEIQGSHLDRVRELLTGIGYRVKLFS